MSKRAIKLIQGALLLFLVWMFADSIRDSWLLINREIPPNDAVGWRTPLSLRDVETWYVINEHVGRILLVSSILATVSASFGFVWFLFHRFEMSKTVVLSIVFSVLFVLSGLVIAALTMPKV